MCMEKRRDFFPAIQKPTGASRSGASLANEPQGPLLAIPELREGGADLCRRRRSQGNRRATVAPRLSNQREDAVERKGFMELVDLNSASWNQVQALSRLDAVRRAA